MGPFNRYDDYEFLMGKSAPSQRRQRGQIESPELYTELDRQMRVTMGIGDVNDLLGCFIPYSATS